MTRERTWPAVDQQRARVADLLDDLHEDEWNHPSLCAGWTVRDVAAHLTLQHLGLGESVAMMARYRGNTERAIRESSQARAAEWSTTRIAATVRDSIGIHRPTFGVTSRETLIDILVHGQDIAIPLGRSLPVTPEAAVIAIDRVFTMHWPPPFPQRRKLSAYRLVATDVEWSRGTGPQLRGPIADLLLLSTGRAAALPRLAGDGVPALVASGIS